MSCQDHSIQTLRDSGHRLTPQRVLILSTLRGADGHMTASEVLEHVRESYPYIDASTVYRTLGVLKNLRLIAETEHQWRRVGLRVAAPEPAPPPDLPVMLQA